MPHFVLPWPQGLAEVPIADLGSRLRHHPDLGPGGANVNFVRWVSEETFRDPHLRARDRRRNAGLRQRGGGLVPGRPRTPASSANGRPPLTSGGFRLKLGEAAEGFAAGQLQISGDARLVARGEWLEGAQVLPAPPRWSSLGERRDVARKKAARGRPFSVSPRRASAQRTEPLIGSRMKGFCLSVV